MNLKRLKNTTILMIFIILLLFSFSLTKLNHTQWENISQLNTSPTYTTEIIRPNADIFNNSFITIPSGVKLYECIDDVSDDGDYIYGVTVGDGFEVDMGQFSLDPGESITAINIYARGSFLVATDFDLSCNFRWRIGSEPSYSSPKNIKFISYDWTTLSTGAWSGLNLNQENLNDLRIRLDLVGIDQPSQLQAVSVLYAELTVKSNENPTVNLISPNGGEILRDNTLIQWSSNDPDGDPLTFDLSYRIDGGSWIPIVSNLVGISSYLWNITTIAPSDNAELRIEASDGDTGYATDTTNDTFTIQYNHDPQVELISPSQGDVLREDFLITWNYLEVDLEPTYFNISYQIDGSNWNTIADSLENQTSYFWNVTDLNGTYYNLSLLIEAYDPFNGYSNDTTQGFFFYIQNSAPQVEIVSPTQGLVIDTRLLIEWNYTDLEDDTVFFNISYSVDGSVWVDIVGGLTNQSGYIWNFEFYGTISNVTIKIIAYDQYLGYTEIIIPGNFTIVGIEPPSPFFLTPYGFLAILISVSISGLVVVGFIIWKKQKKKSLDDKKAPKKLKPDQIEKPNNKNHQKRLIIEADLLIKKGKRPNEMDLISRLIHGENDKNLKYRDEDYEMIKVLGKLNITTLSEEFWNKIEQFEWQDEEKEEFINDMLGLAPECREKFINDMVNKFKGMEETYDS